MALFDKLKQALKATGDFLGVQEELDAKRLEQLKKQNAQQDLQKEILKEEAKIFKEAADFLTERQQQYAQLDKIISSNAEFLQSIVKTAQEESDLVSDDLLSASNKIQEFSEKVFNLTEQVRDAEIEPTEKSVNFFKDIFKTVDEGLKEYFSEGTGIRSFNQALAKQASQLPEEVFQALRPESLGEGLTKQAMERTGTEEFLTGEGFPSGLTGAAAAEALNSIEEIQTAFKQMDFARSLASIDEFRKGVHAVSDNILKLGADMRKTDLKISDAFKNLSTGARNVGAEIKNALDFEIFGTKASVILTGLFLKSLKTVTDQTTQLSKQLGSTLGFAEELRDEMTTLGAAASETGTAFTRLLSTNEELLISQRNVLEARLQLNKGIGAAIVGQQDLVKDQIALVRGFGLQEEKAVNLAKIAVSNQKTTKDVTKEVLAQNTALARQTGIFLDARSVLTEIAGLSADIRAELGFSSENIAEAVTTARSLGTNLTTVQKAAKGLLNFQDSISAELEAQLITGKALNLNQARFNALSGDYAGVAREISNQFASFTEYSQMNVIAQESLARAFGMSQAELAEMVEQQFILNQLGVDNLQTLEEEGRLNELLLIQGGERYYQSQLAQSQAQRLEETFRRLEGVLIDIVDSPLMNLVEGFASLLNNATILSTVIATLTGGAILIGLSSLVTAATALATALGVSAASVGIITGGLALAGAAVGAFALSQAYDDGEDTNTSGGIFSDALPEVQDAYIDSSQGPFSIASMKYGKMMPIARTTAGDNAMFSPNIAPASISNIAAQSDTTINNNNSYAASKMDSKLDEMISSNKAVIAAIDNNTKAVGESARFIAKAKQKLVVGATDLGTNLAVHSYRVQLGVWGVIMLINNYLHMI